MAKSDKLYKDSPKVERDGESGKMEVKTKAREEKATSENSDAGTQGAMENDAVPHYVRHAAERRDMNGRHEIEHGVHDAKTPGQPKKDMHDRHEKEFKEMHSRHEKELAKNYSEGKEYKNGK